MSNRYMQKKRQDIGDVLPFVTSQGTEYSIVGVAACPHFFVSGYGGG